MNAQSIWAGNEYAFLPNSGRSERFSLKCYRVKVIRTKQVTPVGAKRATTLVDLNFLDRDTGEIISFSGDTWYTRGVVDDNGDGSYTGRAYDFVEFWEQVDSQYHHLAKKAAEQKAERDRLQAEREAEYQKREAERREREEALMRERAARVAKIEDYMVGLGIDPDWIRVDMYTKNVTISIDKIERAMEVANEPSTF